MATTWKPDQTFYPSPRGDAGSAGEAGLRGNGSPDALVVMAAVALIVYEKLGLMILKRTWFNVDLI